MKFEISATKGQGRPTNVVRDEDLNAIIDLARRILLEDPETDSIEIKKVE